MLLIFPFATIRTELRRWVYKVVFLNGTNQRLSASQAKQKPDRKNWNKNSSTITKHFGPNRYGTIGTPDSNINSLHVVSKS